MANTILTSNIILKESLRLLKNELAFTKGVNREYEDKFAQGGAKVGETIQIRKPVRYVGRDGAALAVEDTTESTTSLTLDKQSGVDIQFSSKDLTLSIDDFSARYLKPAIVTIANKIDVAGLSLYRDIAKLVSAGPVGTGYGTPGLLSGGTATAQQVQAQILTAGAMLTNAGVPLNDRGAIVDALSQVNLVAPLLSQFNNQSKIAGMFDKGALAQNLLGFDWAVDANTQTMTANTGTVTAISGVPAVNSTNFAVTTTAGTIQKGTVFTIAGVFEINPQSRASTGQLKQFVVTADTVVTTSGTLPVSPAYIPSGQYATCTGTPGASAAVVVNSGAYAQNLAFHKDAFTLATADLVMPKGVDFAERGNSDGISMRIVRAYDINSDNFPCRIDVLYGWKTIYPELAVRLQG